MSLLRRSTRRSKRFFTGAKPELEDPTKTKFGLTCTDVLLEVNKGYQLSQVRIEFYRHGAHYRSPAVRWESSLKSPSVGYAFFDPAYKVDIAVSHGEKVIHKDVYLAAYNFPTDAKGGKEKLLAKTRLDLWQYKDCSETQKVKLKLFPETKKIAKCFVNLVIEKNSATLAPPVAAGDSSRAVVADSVSLGSRASALTPDFSRMSTKSNASSADLIGAIGSDLDNHHKSPSHSRTSSSVKSDHQGEALTPTSSKDPVSSSFSFVRTSERSSARRNEEVVPVSKSPVPNLSEPVNSVVSPPLCKIPAKLSPDRSTSSVPPTVVFRETTKETVTISSVSKTAKSDEKKTVTTTETIATSSKSAEETVVASDPFDVVLANDRSAQDKEVTEQNIHKEHKSVEGDKSKRMTLTIGNKLVNKTNSLLTPQKGSKGGDNLLEWAKGLLKKYSMVKITNMTSSWRNGMGFVCLLHSNYPNLVPLSELNVQSVELNFSIAFAVSKLIGMELPDSLQHVDPQRLTQTHISLYLSQLKAEMAKNPEVSKEVEEAHQKEWNGKCGLFKALFPEKAEEKSPEPKPQSKNKTKVREIMAKAHNNEELQKQVSEDKISLESPSNGDTEIMTAVGKEELKKISDELKNLEAELEMINQEKSKLEAFLREADEDENEDVFNRFMFLVNEKNAKVRRQMQLNIFEKQAIVSQKQMRINAELQKLSLMPEENKTEASRAREKELLQQHLDLVNEKNELIHHLDTQEKAIHEDETIEASVGSGMHGQKSKEEECCIQ